MSAVIVIGASARNAAVAAAPGQHRQTAAPQAHLHLAPYWLSATTRNVYRVQMKGTTLTADWVNIPKPEAERGAYIRTECHRAGKKWVGATKSFLRCETENKQGRPYSNWCHILTQIQISDVSAGRIEGKAEALKRFDCRQCRALDTQWKNFVWSPAPLRPAPLAGSSPK
ncbi:MAG: hypothetical protein ACRD1J_07885 [Terriglobia bacterium]